MSSRPQLSPEVSYERSMFDTNSLLTPNSEGTVAVSCPNVLLVGRSGSWGTLVLKSLEKFGSELSFAAPQTVTSEYVRNGAYNLVLLDSTVPPEQRRQLASELLGSSVSIFYTFPVENGCWWLPALRRGHDCHGAPAFRRNEFPLELERILRNHAEALAEDCFPHRVAADA
jgi:hypothetical protein